MKAARIHEYGDASVIRYDDVPRPAPGPGEVLVEVAATSFNPTETALRAGLLQRMFPLELPHTLGWDVAGTVAEVADDVTSRAVGERVVGRVDRGGAAAEYVTVPADALVPAPKALSLAEAAAIPVAGLAAWQAVITHAGVSAGQRVLINGAGGGIGGFAVQLAKRAGAEVIATASPRSAEALRRYGADRLIDYTATPVAHSLNEQVDTLINLVPLSPHDAAALVPLVRAGGVIVSVATPLEPLPGTPVTARHVVARNDVSDLAALTELIDAGDIRVEATETAPLRDLGVVHRRSEAGDTHGKIIIIP